MYKETDASAVGEEGFLGSVKSESSWCLPARETGVIVIITD